MSLSRLAMRVAAARAIRGATLAENRVYDSAIDPIDQTIVDNRLPIVTVSTEDHDATITGRDLFHANHSCRLVIETAVASRVVIEGTSEMAIPHTDEGMEIVLDIMEHQIMAALIRERTPWSRVWMRLVPVVKDITSKRAASSEGGVRYAARQIIITCDLISAPTDGGAIVDGSTWADTLAVFEADSQMAPIGQLLRTTITGEPLAEWRRDANRLGVPLAVADAIGLGPVSLPSDDPAELAEASLTGGLNVVANEDTIEEQMPNGNP